MPAFTTLYPNRMQVSGTASSDSDQENHTPQRATGDSAAAPATAPGSVQPRALCDGVLRLDALRACAAASVARQQLEAVSPVSLLSLPTFPEYDTSLCKALHCIAAGIYALSCFARVPERYKGSHAIWCIDFRPLLISML